MNNALDDLGTSIGPYYVGSVPRPLDITVTMEDDTTPVDITGAEASFSYKIDNGTARWAEAEVHDGPNGIIRINWAESDFLTAGTMRGIAYWAVEGNVEAAALVWCSVRTPPAPIVPGANPSPPIDGGDASTEYDDFLDGGSAVQVRQIRVRRDTPSAWTSANPVLGQGEFGASYDAGELVELKLGDGGTEWEDLDSILGGGAPSGGAGGALSGTYPNPGLNVEVVQDLVAAFIVAGDNVTKVYDDTANTLTISATGGGGGGASTLPELTDVAAIEGPTDSPGAETFDLVLTDNTPVIDFVLGATPDRFGTYGLTDLDDTAVLAPAGNIVASAFEIDWPSDARQQGDSVEQIVVELDITSRTESGSLFFGAVQGDVLAAGELTAETSDNPDVTVLITQQSGFQSVSFGSETEQQFTITLTYTPHGPMREHIDPIHLEMGWFSPGADIDLTWTAGDAPGYTGAVVDQGADLIESAFQVDLQRIADEAVDRNPPPLLRLVGEDNEGNLADSLVSRLDFGSGDDAADAGIALRDLAGNKRLIPVKLWTPKIYSLTEAWDPTQAGSFVANVSAMPGSPHADVLFLAFVTVTSDESYPGEVVPFTMSATNAGNTITDTRPVPLAGGWAIRVPLVATIDLYRDGGDRIDASVEVSWPAYTAETLTNPVIDVEIFMLAEKYWT